MRLRRWSLLVLGAVSSACAPTIGPITPPVEVLVVLDSLDDTLRIIPVDSVNIVHRVVLNLGNAVANTLAVNGQIAAIGLAENSQNTLDNVLLYDLGAQHAQCGGPLPLHGNGPVGALAFGVAGEVYAATPSTDSISTAFPTCGVGSQGAVAGTPDGFGVARGVVYVVIANRERCLPVGLSCPSWLVPLPERRGDSIPLLGPGGAQGAVFGPDGFLYVANAGTGRSDGVLSQVDPVAGTANGISGFGHLPQYVATDASSRIFVVSPIDGLMVYNVRTHAIERGPNSVSVGTPRGIAVDDVGRIYLPQASSCAPGTHGSVVLLGADLVQHPAIPVGRCPVAVAVTDIPAGDYRFH